MTLDINDPKIRWAQQIADSMQEDQVIIRNLFNGYDIKRASAVPLVNNPEVLFIIEPQNRRQKGFENEWDCVYT